MPSKINIIGKKFGRMTVISECKERRCTVIYYLCECDCGTRKIVQGQSLRIGAIKSCGCYQKESAKIRNTTHGLSKHPLYKTWHSMLSRCYNIKDSSYYAYGKRGVTVCKKWANDFISFYKWGIANGWKNGLQLDKDIKGTGMLYSPINCMFVTVKENAKEKISNVYIKYKGVYMIASDVANELGMSSTALAKRIKKWGLKEALGRPIDKSKISR